jgi:hypothetical protein
MNWDWTYLLEGDDKRAQSTIECTDKNNLYDKRFK